MVIPLSGICRQSHSSSRVWLPALYSTVTFLFAPSIHPCPVMWRASRWLYNDVQLCELDTFVCMFWWRCRNLKYLDVIGLYHLTGHCLQMVPELVPHLKFLDLTQCNSVRLQFVFTRMMLCTVQSVLAVANCPSICLSQSEIVLKWFNLSVKFFHHLIAPATF